MGGKGYILNRAFSNKNWEAHIETNFLLRVEE